MRSVKKRIVKGLGTLVLSLLAVGACAAADSEDRASWRHLPVWDDGNAEFCAYEVEWSRYGELFPGRALLILVKEPWAPDLEVKADRQRPDGFDVLKLNHIRDVPTGIYTYHQMASTFVRRDTGQLQKLSVSSSEGCGISTAHMVGGRINTRSYFDGQGETSRPYPDEALPEDGLAASLRDYLAGKLPASVDVVPSFMTGRLPEPRSRTYSVTRVEGRRSVPAGDFEIVELRLESGRDWLSFAFDGEAPHQLIEHRASSGTTYRLAKCERIPYWSMNRPGGEEWLPASVR